MKRSPRKSLGLSFWVAQNTLLLLIAGYIMWGVGYLMGFFSKESYEMVFLVSINIGIIVGLLDFVIHGG